MWWLRVFGTLVAVGAVMLGGLALQPAGTRTVPIAGPPPPPPPEPPPAPPPAGPPVLAVKVDNAPPARPPTGIGAADIVYVEPVEAGISRLIAVFGTRRPPVVGPVRSARQTDLRLLPQFGRPALAFSGAAPELLPEIGRTPVVSAPPEAVPGAFYRGPGQKPHNLYVRPARLPAGGGWSPNAALTFGPVPGGGVPASAEEVAYRSARVGFTWSPAQQRWLVSMDGRPYAATDSGRLAASTVVLQEVPVSDSPFQDVVGNASPFAETVGTGRAVVLRDGAAFEGRWHRPAPELGTTYATPAGEPIPFAPGQIWIVLVPAP
ncbi:Protein of unknown function [Saccharopolyspora kobensis]|uniref:DUF3048 family protein n=1 Tax=Saccharopolyspora kobensis TaxID=146035 RepID=A0A1H6E813_9PSEU|nr:DUF3048 domain-containing protein [Saccharopolyspora kobensis]SEG93391.1 Protein of unknown function [Saccharopolyspora kobensis]SFD44815.1 Protein of unknown function [Saccharopolyspora kobensis]